MPKSMSVSADYKLLKNETFEMIGGSVNGSSTPMISKTRINDLRLTDINSLISV